MKKPFPRDAFWRKHANPKVSPPPTLQGRQIDRIEAEERSETELIAATEIPLNGCIVGTTKAELFQSVGKLDDGGFVLRLSSDNESGFVAHAITLNDGVEMHVAGGEEGTAALRVLQAVIATALSARLS